MAKAKDIVANKKDVVLLDVRTPEEIAQGKIDKAVELDIKDPAFRDKLNALDKTKQYMVYCYAGGRSATAMKTMKELGFKQVYNFDGGYKAWSSGQ
jgi:rhodanese-related sulfurtransferase